MIKVQNVSKKYNTEESNSNILEDISFTLGKRQIISIIGKTGCGKTSLLNIVSGLMKPDCGKVDINGSISYVFQTDSLLAWRTVLENILLPAEIKREVDEVVVTKARKIIKHLGLENFANSYPCELSGGMKQKAALAKMYIEDSDIVLFDEPFSAIDFNSRLKLVEETRKSLISLEKSAIFVTHNIEEAISISDIVIVLGGYPAKITFKANIDIPDNERGFLVIKKNDKFNSLFKKIWSITSAE